MTVKRHPFKQLRAAHHREKAEDYVEMIDELIRERGEARLTELAKRFGVSNVTAHKIVARLDREKLLRVEPYQPIRLTPSGERLAKLSRQRHEVVYNFLLSIGVPEIEARVDAEGIEHHVSPETLSRFEEFVDRRGIFQKPPK